MVNNMNDINYIKINTQNILDNIAYLKNNYPYDHYIVNVSNDTFWHGMYLIQYIKSYVDYLYVNDFHDLLLIRKYDKDIPVIYDGMIHEDNIYDLIMNNTIVVIHDFKILQYIKNLKIKDQLSFLFYIDPTGYFGIDNKQDILDFLEWDQTYFHLLGVMAQLNEKDYDNFKYIIRPIVYSELMILNHEEDKRKIQGSNTILLDYSIYGIQESKKKIFQKKEQPFKQAFTLYSKIIHIKKEQHNKKVKYTAVVPFGYHHGMGDEIKNVYINHQLYHVQKIMNEVTYIEVDEIVDEGMKVEITSFHNPLDQYFSSQTLNYFSFFHSNISIVYDDYVLDAASMY